MSFRLQKIRDIAEQIAEHRAAIERLMPELKSHIARATEKGVSRRDVAEAAGISAARVQQIVEEPKRRD